MTMLRGAVAVVLAILPAGCGHSGSSPAPSAPSPVPAAPVPPPIPSPLTGLVLDTALRAIAGALVEVLDGPQSGASTISDAGGAFSLKGTFDGTTRFRASRDGYVAETQSFVSMGSANTTLFFRLEVVGGSVNLAGDYTVTFIADSACAGQLPNDALTRTYAATISPDRARQGNTAFLAALSGAGLDSYYNKIVVDVAGDYVSFDLSDNVVEEEVVEGAYLTIGGEGAASVGTSDASTISARFQGVFDYCVPKSEPLAGSLYSCTPDNSTVHAQCASMNHRLVLTRR
jgi:hypothetical protein